MAMRDSEIYEISVSDGSQVQLTDRRGPDGSPIVSPDGRHIAYLGNEERNLGYQLTKLYVMNRDGSGARSISDHLDRTVGSPQWAPDGSGIYAAYTDQGDPKLALFSLNGSHEVVAEELGSGQSAYAGAAGYSLGSDGSIAFLTNGPHRPGDVAVMRPGGGASVLTEVNADQMGVFDRRSRDPRLDHQASGIRPRSEIPADSGNPRRTVRGLR